MLVSAEAMLRARPAAAFALLNHILINGFFFNQGFAIAFVPFQHSVDFMPPRRLSNPTVHAGKPNERGAELAEGLPQQGGGLLSTGTVVAR